MAEARKYDFPDWAYRQLQGYIEESDGLLPEWLPEIIRVFMDTVSGKAERGEGWPRLELWLQKKRREQQQSQDALIAEIEAAVQAIADEYDEPPADDPPEGEREIDPMLREHSDLIDIDDYAPRKAKRR